jgi:hypothetical protein
MEHFFVKVDSLSPIKIGRKTYLVGEDQKQKCDYCSQNSISHRIVLGKYAGERTIEDKACLGMLPFEDTFLSERKLREFSKLTDSIKTNNLMFCAVRVYTPHGAEVLEEIGDFEEISVRTGKVLKSHKFEESFEKIMKQKSTDKHESS